MPGRTPTVLRVEDGGVSLAGQPLYVGDLASLLDEFDRRRGTAPTLVTTPNVDQTLVLGRDPVARRAFVRADIRTVDGAPLVALARLLGARGLRRITGADLLVACSAAAAERGWRVAVTGGPSDVTARAAARLRDRYPGAHVVDVPFPVIASVAAGAVGTAATEPATAAETAGSAAETAGSGGEAAGSARDDGREVVDRLVALAPDVVFLCLGSPKQEAWFLRWEHALPTAVYVGAGAAVEFAAGARRRAPALVQRLGLEWTWRLVQEPRRLAHRYLVRGPAFTGVVVRSVLAARRDGARA